MALFDICCFALAFKCGIGSGLCGSWDLGKFRRLPEAVRPRQLDDWSWLLKLGNRKKEDIQV